MTESRMTYRNSDGVRRTSIVDTDRPGELVVKTEVDVTRLLENNKALRELHPEKSVNKLVARVPMTVYEQSIHENWDEGDWKKWLNDPDNAMFRVWAGRV